MEYWQCVLSDEGQLLLSLSAVSIIVSNKRFQPPTGINRLYKTWDTHEDAQQLNDAKAANR